METEKYLLVLHTKLPDNRDFPQKKKKNCKVIKSSESSEVYSLLGTVTRTKQR